VARATIGVILCGALAAPASAQIYSWRDDSGNLVLSDQRPSGAAVRTFAVPDASSVRVTRSTPASFRDQYDALIRDHARLNGVRPDLVRAVVQVESGFNPRARSPKGALGLMQLMPATIREFGVRNPFNPEDNVRAGVAYLRQLIDRYDGNEQLALAAYNAGPSAVDRHGEAIPPYPETRAYVSKVNKAAGHLIERHSNRIYKVTEVIDGRTVVRYTDRKPSSGDYEIVGRRPFGPGPF
jgi:soluble lytic murein transglycosylase-like protein